MSLKILDDVASAVAECWVEFVDLPGGCKSASINAHHAENREKLGEAVKEKIRDAVYRYVKDWFSNCRGFELTLENDYELNDQMAEAVGRIVLSKDLPLKAWTYVLCHEGHFTFMSICGEGNPRFVKEFRDPEMGNSLLDGLRQVLGEGDELQGTN